jgi:hypothetical protein
MKMIAVRIQVAVAKYLCRIRCTFFARAAEKNRIGLQILCWVR